MSDHDSDSFGDCLFGEAETVAMVVPGDKTREFAVERAVGHWHPPARLAAFLPPQFSLPLECYTGSDGLRRVVPACNFEALIDWGAVGGLAVMHGLHGFDKHADDSYKAMHLIHQYVRGRSYQGTRGMREHLNRNFNYSRDLFVRRSGRSADSSRDVLPDDVGLSAEGHGKKWSVTALTKIGREAAREAGYVNPVSEQAISFGLYEAARRNPLEVPAEQVPTLVRLALFDVDDHSVSSELLEQVKERLVVALQEHLGDSRDDFHNWLFGSHSSLIKQIAQQKKQPGGRLDQADVRRAILHLGWQAYGYVGRCVHTLMQTVKNALPDLHEHERRLFEHMHESQDYYGGDPAALLAERMSFLRRGVLAIWNDPGNRKHVAVLHRLLQYYAQMESTRRLADRETKRKLIRPTRSESTEECDSPEESVEALDELLCSDEEDILRQVSSSRHHITFSDTRYSRIPQPDVFGSVANHLRVLSKIECPADCQYWHYWLKNETADMVAIGVRCECQQVNTTIELSRGEFVHQARWFAGP